MNKYIATIDGKTLALAVICVIVTYVCYRYNISYDLNITLFSIAVVFPLVFTIREAFKRRDSALKFLSLFKASMSSVHYCFAQCKKLDSGQQAEVTALLQRVSALLFEALASRNCAETTGRRAEEAVNDIFYFIQRNKDAISSGLTLKIIRFVQDVNESVENTVSLKIHGTPISMRAYCLVFVFLFPFVFAPTIVYHLPDAPAIITYGLAVLHGFVLISLYNVQTQMENPFDQVGLDDIRLEEYAFRPLQAPLDETQLPPNADSPAAVEAPRVDDADPLTEKS